MIGLISHLGRHVTIIQKDKANGGSPKAREVTIYMKPDDNNSKCLLSEDIIQKHFNYKGKPELIAKLVAHLSFNNKSYTKKICAMILKNVNEQDLYKGALFVWLIPELVMVQDSLQQLRIEWLFGYPCILHKIEYGLAHVSDISDEVYTFVSSLGIRKKDEPLIQLLWKHRRRVEPFTPHGIKMMFQLMTVCEAFKDYMKKIPAHSYVHENYVAWMEYYLSHVVIENAADKAPAAAEKTEKELVIAEAKALAERFSKVDHAAKHTVIVPESVPSSPPSLSVATPYNYMIGKMTKIKVFKEWSKGSLKLEISEVYTEVYPSIPTGERNEAIDSEFLQR